MPTRHEKIREIVSTVRRMRSVSMADLVDDIDRRASAGQSLPFVYRHEKSSRGKGTHIPCKGPTIRRHVRFCRDLGLLVEGDQISLHPEVRELRTAKAFDLAIRTRLLEYMEKRGAGFDKIQEAITSEDITDPHTIFGHVEPQGLSEEEFSSCLNLLATVSDEIAAFQKKQYVLKNA
jgi:hypothetical protein